MDGSKHHTAFSCEICEQIYYTCKCMETKTVLKIGLCQICENKMKEDKE